MLTLEGGYDLAGLAKSVHACIDVMTGDEPPSVDQSASARAEAYMRAAIGRQREF